MPADDEPRGNLSFEEAAAALADYREAARITPTAKECIADRMQEALLKRDKEGP